MATITKQMSIGEVLNLDRSTAAIMMQYGMHCMGCPMSQMESLEMACAAHGTDVDELVEKLNAYLAGQQA
jgi:hybrid cluster-associated redox disulfide protein